MSGVGSSPEITMSPPNNGLPLYQQSSTAQQGDIIQRAPMAYYQTQYTPSAGQTTHPPPERKPVPIAQAAPAGTPPAMANAVPLGLLGRFPATVYCPVCGQMSHTGVKYEVGRATHSMDALFFFTTGFLFFLPYVTNSFKDVRHTCRRCARELATFHYGKGTEAHLL